MFFGDSVKNVNTASITTTNTPAASSSAASAPAASFLADSTLAVPPIYGDIHEVMNTLYDMYVSMSGVQPNASSNTLTYATANSAANAVANKVTYAAVN